MTMSGMNLEWRLSLDRRRLQIFKPGFRTSGKILKDRGFHYLPVVLDFTDMSGKDA